MVRLKRPDNTEKLVNIIGALDFLTPVKGNCQLVIMLLAKTREDVPIGTEVWAVEKSA